MDNQKYLKALAPCGINCERCVGFVDGEIKKACEIIQKGLDGFEKLAEKFSTFVPIFKNFKQFEEILNFFANADCTGCRNGKGKNATCNVMNCFKEKSVDFCAACDEFPCDKTGLDDNLKQKWLENNKKIKEIGLIKFYKESIIKSRY